MSSPGPSSPSGGHPEHPARLRHLRGCRRPSPPRPMAVHAAAGCHPGLPLALLRQGASRPCGPPGLASRVPAGSSRTAVKCWEGDTTRYPRLFARWAWVPYSWWSGWQEPCKGRLLRTDLQEHRKRPPGGYPTSGDDQVDAVGDEPQADDQAPPDDHLVGVGVDPAPGLGQQRLALARPETGVDLHRQVRRRG